MLFCPGLIEGDEDVAILQLANARVSLPVIGVLVNGEIFWIFDLHYYSPLGLALSGPDTGIFGPSV